MDKLMKATGVGLKHFFGARDSISTLMERGRQFSAAETKLKKSEILAIMGMYAIKKGSPIGLGTNIRDNIKVGYWKYTDLKDHQRNAESFLVAVGMSPQGAEAAARRVTNLAADGAVYSVLSPQDAVIFAGFRNDLAKEAGQCINF